MSCPGGFGLCANSFGSCCCRPQFVEMNTACGLHHPSCSCLRPKPYRTPSMLSQVTERQPQKRIQRLRQKLQALVPSWIWCSVSSSMFTLHTVSIDPCLVCLCIYVLVLYCTGWSSIQCMTHQASDQTPTCMPAPPKFCATFLA